MLQVFVDLMSYATPRGPDPRWPEISSLLSGALQEALAGSRSPREALAEAQKGLLAVRGAKPSSTTGGRGPDGG
jgi:multiple sugar transport system substrate-binding protein